MVFIVPRQPDPVRRAYVGMTLMAGVIGAVMLGAGLRKWGSHPTSLVLFGGLHLAVAAYSAGQQILAALSPPGRRETGSAELAVLLLCLPYCLLAVWIGVVGPRPETRVVSGRPIEVRAQSRSVFMPGGGRFTYTCWKDEGRSSGTCPAEARWDALPRWPEPDEVRMEVDGRKIRGLTMDGVVIVEPAEFVMGDRLKRVLMLTFGPLLTVLTAVGVARRVRQLASRGG